MTRACPREIWLSFSLLLACSGSATSQADAGARGSLDGSGGPMDAGAATTDASSAGETDFVAQLLGSPSVGQVDLLFMIDNSLSMSDKQTVLKAAVPDLVSRLVNPVCVDAQGNQFPAPETPDGACPSGQTRQFNPIDDLHVGIVTSSLGDVGANVACPSQGNPNYRPDQVDMAHLMGSLSRSTATTNAQGFLEWHAGAQPLDGFNQQFQQMVADVGERGCGWEASLESWYRFLVDPFPYQNLVKVPCPGSASAAANCIQPAKDDQNRIIVDQTVLDQRNAFLRADSLLAVVMLTDENDCSVQVGNQTWLVLDLNDQRAMFRGSSKCAEDPNDKCCYSCPLGPPDGCATDPICAANPDAGVLQNRLPDSQDGKNLRCLDQKRRFGVDFLYPTRRYVNALTQAKICWNAIDLSIDGCAAEDILPNPLFAGGRSPSRVFLAGILGVPWQAIASDVDANGRPLSDSQQLRFQSYAELTANGAWAQIVGSPGVPWKPAQNGTSEVAGQPGTPPLLPYMLESTSPRVGVTPGNAYNGREFDTTQGSLGSEATADDLEYACIFPLDSPKDCSQLSVLTDACDCFEGTFDRPLCEQTPGQSSAGTVQYWAKAYPGLRELEVLKDFGAATTNSIVASICARNVSDTQAPDYGYRPAVAAIVDRLQEQLYDRCLPRPLSTAADGTIPCTLVEATPQPASTCTCDSASARRAPSVDENLAVRAQLAQQGCGADDPACRTACLCEVLQVQQVDGQDPVRSRQTCEQSQDGGGVVGWCYLDGAAGSGESPLLSHCPSTEQQRIRILGGHAPQSTVQFLVCPPSNAP